MDNDTLRLPELDAAAETPLAQLSNPSKLAVIAYDQNRLVAVCGVHKRDKAEQLAADMRAAGLDVHDIVEQYSAAEFYGRATHQTRT